MIATDEFIRSRKTHCITLNQVHVARCLLKKETFQSKNVILYPHKQGLGFYN